MTLFYSFQLYKSNESIKLITPFFIKLWYKIHIIYKCRIYVCIQKSTINILPTIFKSIKYYHKQ